MKIEDSLNKRIPPVGPGRTTEGMTNGIATSKNTTGGNVDSSQRPFEAAQQLAGWGLNVLPAKVGQKAPSVSWKTYQRKRTDVELGSLFGNADEANYWVATGPTSGVFVLDIDNDAAETWWRATVGFGPQMDATVCARTSKGHHYYFALPEGADWKGWSYHEGDLSFDVRGDGQGVIAPPSIHESGVVYEWVRSPDDCKFLPVPEWLQTKAQTFAYAGVAKSEPEPRKTLAGLLANPPKGSDSGRNNWLTKVAGHLARQYRDSETEYWRALTEANRNLSYPLDDQEVEKTGASIWGTDSRNHPGEPPAKPAEEEKTEKKSAATLLVELAEEIYRFGQSEEGDVFGLKPGSHVVRNLSGDKTSLRSELSIGFYRRYKKAPAQQALADAQKVIEGAAQEKTPEAVALRVAEAEGAIWVDLGGGDERVIRIADGNWEIRDEAPVLFARTALTAELPVPQRGVDLERLWGHLNVNELDRPLVLAWLAQALLQPGLPHPVLTLFGEQGTAKSTLTRRLVSLIDPSPVPVRKPPKDGEAWISAAQGSYVVGLDNLSSIPDWFSDALCRAATGDGDIRRTLYQDKRLTVFAFRRAVVLNGIDVGALRGDLASRAVLVNLDRITTVRTERAMAEEWEADYPGLVGAVLSFVAKVREELPNGSAENPPRMADYANVLAATDRLLGTNGLSRYGDLEETLAEDSITANPFLAQIVEQGRDISGTAKEIHQRIGQSDHWQRAKGWPSTPRYVTTLLTRNAPALRKAGWEVESIQDRHKKVTIWYLTAPKDGQSDLF